MSRIEWLILFVVFVGYVLVGGIIFQEIESREETAKREEAAAQRLEIQELVQKELQDGSPERARVLARLADYCGKPLVFPNASAGEKDDSDKEQQWDFYNSFFVAITIVSTIGYGNLTPTTTGTRMFCIVYALIGIPLNGILLAGLGEYFSRTFLRAHHRYKEAPEVQGRPALLLKVAQYLAAGIGIFILLPAVVFAVAEGWTYEEAVYYAFVTLSTIGFGEYVAGYMTTYNSWKYSPGLLVAYRTFIVLWIVFGLGYLAMILSFITRAMRSSRIRRLEHRMAKRFKSTHARLWHGATRDIGYLRRVLNELYMLKFKVRLKNHKSCCRLVSVSPTSTAATAADAAADAINATSKPMPSIIENNNNYFKPSLLYMPIIDSMQSLEKLSTTLGREAGTDKLWGQQPVYRARQSLAPTLARERSNSLPARLPTQIAPDDAELDADGRRRFDSEGPGVGLPRTLSESCLDMIDRSATFAAAPRRVDTSELLATVVDALVASETASEDEEEEEAGAYHGFSDAEILASEVPASMRSRASSLAQSLRSRSGARSRAGSIRSLADSLVARTITPTDWDDVEAARRAQQHNRALHRGRESPMSLRKVLAMRSAGREMLHASSASVSGSPLPRRFERRAGVPRDMLDRRRSEGAIVVPQRLRAASVSTAQPQGLQQLDDTTLGDLLRALHSLHSRVEPSPLRTGSVATALTPEELAAVRAAQSRRGSRVLVEDRPPYSRRGSRLDSFSSAVQSATSSPRPQPSRLAQRLLERLENGQAGRSADVEASVRPSEVISRTEPGRRSRGRRTGQGEPSVILEEPSSTEVPTRDVLSYDQEKGPPKAQTSSGVLKAVSVTGTYRQIDAESKPKEERKPLQVHRAKEEKISDSDSEKSIIISRL